MAMSRGVFHLANIQTLCPPSICIEGGPQLVKVCSTERTKRLPTHERSGVNISPTQSKFWGTNPCGHTVFRVEQTPMLRKLKIMGK